VRSSGFFLFYFLKYKILNRSRALSHSCDFFFFLLFFVPQTGFVCWFIFSSFSPVKIMRIFFFKVENEKEERTELWYVCM
jgi:hypothetical protein